MVEQAAHNRPVVGSNPTGSTIFKKGENKMNWEDILEKTAYYSKWFLMGYCVGHTLMAFGTLPLSNVVLIGATTGIVVADWINRARD